MTLACVTLAASAVGQAQPSNSAGASLSDEDAALFTEQVLPVLQAQCFKCHGPDARRIRGGLLMDGKDSLLIGGDTGPAIVDGNADESPLIQYVRWLEPFMEMPPKEQLPEADIALLSAWIDAGAPWPGGVEHSRGSAEPEHAESASSAELARSLAPTFDSASLQWFEQEIRPLLAEHCFECHGPRAERLKGGLRMSHTGALLAGGESGPAVSQTSPESSLLLSAVHYEDGLEMPPSGRLSQREIDLLTEWVKRGAPMPPPPEDLTEIHEEEFLIDMESGREWWAWNPVQRPEPPHQNEDGLLSETQPIDAFIAARLTAAELEAAPRADERTQITRATIDLTGLPPTYEDVEAYLTDTSPDKWSRLIDRLLDSPHYGEHQARMWLDVVRFAQSNGYEKDEEKPFAWRYRDYVIKAFNNDKPYDQFLIEQLAGDELEPATEEGVIATGFYRLGAWDSEPDNVNQARYDNYDDILRVIGEGMMGVTVGCARCHDHKFDPIRQTDYFSLLGFVENVRPYQLDKFSLDSPTLSPLGLNDKIRETWHTERTAERAAIKARTEELYLERWNEILRIRFAEMPEEVPAKAYAALETPGPKRTARQRSLLEKVSGIKPTRAALRKSFRQDQATEFYRLQTADTALTTSYEGDLKWALTVKEFGRDPKPTRLHVRGEVATPREEVPLSFLPALCPDDEAARPSEPQPSTTHPTSGRRSELAQWIASTSHPTTARVMANRVWQGLFDRGLVGTPNDFGVAGEAPSHPELLDWLAAEFMESGWSIKHLQREIMQSEAYRRSSLHDNPEADAADPGNSLIWRQNLYRLKAEQVRDSVLAVSASLDLEPGGRGFFPELSREALGGNDRPGGGWDLSDEEQRSRRSIYMFAKRGVPVPLLSVLDLANPSLSVGRRSSTTVASQSLSLLNSDFMNKQARTLTQRVSNEIESDITQQVVRLFELTLARRPTPQELTGALNYLSSQSKAFAALDGPLRVRAKVPDRLDGRYLMMIPASEMLYGPKQGWSALKGAWGNPYNGTKVALRDLGPSLILDTPVLTDASLSGRMLITDGCTFGAVQLRVQPMGDMARGLSVVFDPMAGSGEVRVVAWDGPSPDPTIEPTARVLARVDAPILNETWYEFRVTAKGPQLSVELEGRPLLEVSVDLMEAGHIGLSQGGESLVLDDLVLTGDTLAQPLKILPTPPGSPEQRALESFALALLNTNEFLTVD